MGLFGFKLVRQPRKFDASELELKISELSLRVAKMESHIVSLRGFVNRKLDFPSDEKDLKELGAIDDGLNELRRK